MVMVNGRNVPVTARNSELALGKHGDFARKSTRFGAFLRTYFSSHADMIMYDSTSLFSIPLNAKAVASYLTGYPQSPAAWARFKGKLEVTIVQHSGVYNEGDVLDVENGAATVHDVYAFITQRREAGVPKPTIYTSVSWVPAIRQASGKYRLGIDYDLWVAGWTGAPHVGYPGAAATQYASTRSYDLSVIHHSDWPTRAGVTPTPTPTPTPTLPTLRIGSVGPKVKLLQSTLNARHDTAVRDLAVDGNFGPLTNARVRLFQRNKKILVDGIVGPQTWAALGVKA